MRTFKGVNRRVALAAAAGAFAAAAFASGPASAQVDTIRFAKGFGIPYLPVTVMDQQKLVEKQAAAAGYQTTLDLGDAECGLLRRHDQIGGQRQLAPSGEAVALDGCDQGFDWRLLGEAETASADRHVLAARERLEIHTRAERAAGTGDDADRQSGVAVETVHGLGEPLAHLRVDGVLGLRPVDGDDQDPVALFDQYCLFAVVSHGADRNGRRFRPARCVSASCRCQGHARCRGQDRCRCPVSSWAVAAALRRPA